MENAPRNDATRGSEQVSCSRIVTTAGYLLLAISFSLCAGCATAGKAKVGAAEPTPAAAAEPSSAEKSKAEPAEPKLAVAEPSPLLPAGPSVTHLTDGREGFQITQLTKIGGQLRADFDQASSLIREAKYDKAIELLENVIAQAPELTAPRINVAIAYRQINKPEQAEQHLAKALESIPGHPVASNEYGLLLRKAGRFAEARAIYEKSLAVFPEYYPIHKNLGILCDLYLKDPACAAQHYEIYGKAMPRDDHVKLWIADLQTRAGSSMTASAKVESGTARP